MRIECPACAATYDVSETLLAPARPVRCLRCGAQWLPLAAGPGAAVQGSPVPTGPVPADTGPADTGPADTAPATAAPIALTPLDATPRPVTPALPPPPPNRTSPHPLSPRPVPPRAEPPPHAALPPHAAPALQTGRAPAPVTQAPGRAAPLVAWLVSLAVLAVLVALLLRYHAEVSALWPPAARLFAWLGLVGP